MAKYTAFFGIVCGSSIAGIVAATVGCSSGEVVDPGRGNGGAVPDTIVLSPSSVSVGAPDWVIVRAQALDQLQQPVGVGKIAWSSENPNIAFVSVLMDSVIAVVGSAPGTTVVTASFEGKTTRIPVSVSDPVVGIVALAPAVTALESGSSRRLQLFEMTAGNNEILQPSAVWSSSDSTVVSVDQNGNLIARSQGSATISATAGGVAGTAAVYVPTPYMGVAASTTSACALKADGRIFCWGGSAWSPTGTGSLASRYAPSEVITSQRFTRIHALAHAMCASTPGGDLYCWGQNGGGTLGVEDQSDPVTTPSRVRQPEPFVQIATGTNHICAIGQSGKTYCWGYGLASGSTTGSVATPTELKTPAPLLQVVAGGGYSCGLANDQRVYCWGADDAGQLGDGAPETQFGAGRSIGEPVTGGHVFRSLFAEANGAHTCAIDTMGDSYCWGDYVEDDNAPTTMDCGRTATKYGPYIVRCSPLPVRVSAPTPFVALSMGTGRTCGVDVGGVSYCWGQQYDANIGYQRTPVRVNTSLAFKSISSGFFFNCGLATNELVYCWGRNIEGEVGDYSVVPVVPGAMGPNGYGRGSVDSPSLIAAP